MIQPYKLELTPTQGKAACLLTMLSSIAVFMGGGPGGKKVEALDVYHPHITAFFCTVVAAVAATAAAQVHKLCKGH